VGARDERLAHGAAHLLLLGALLAVGHLGRDLGQRLDGVVAGLAGPDAVGASDRRVRLRVEFVVPRGVHSMIMPAPGDKAGAVGSDGGPSYF
jgi:hypothetical protein